MYVTALGAKKQLVSLHRQAAGGNVLHPAHLASQLAGVKNRLSFPMDGAAMDGAGGNRYRHIGLLQKSRLHIIISQLGHLQEMGKQMAGPYLPDAYSLSIISWRLNIDYYSILYAQLLYCK